MTVRVAINGFGRIGRGLLRAAHGRGLDIEWGYATRLAELAGRVLAKVPACT